MEDYKDLKVFRTISIGFVVSLLRFIEPAYAFEVSTHARMTEEAISKSQGLQQFLTALDQSADLGVPRVPEGFLTESEREFLIEKTFGYHERHRHFLLLSGSALEDDSVRFFNHFLDPQEPVGSQGFKGEGTGLYIDARAWGMGESDLGLLNEYSLKWAHEYYRRYVTSASPAEREFHLAKLLRSLGHCVHLVQDLAQPSHTRNDSHGGIGDGRSLLEEYCDRVFTARTRNLEIDRELTTLVHAHPRVYYPSIVDYFEKTAEFSNENFFSDDTILYSDYSSPGNGIPVVEGSASGFIRGTLGAPLPRFNGEKVRLARWRYSILVNPGLDIFFVPITPAIPVGQHLDASLSDDGETVLFDNAGILIPRAVSTSAGLLDHFFRGKIELIHREDDALVVRNASDPTVTAGSTENVVFLKGRIKLYFEDEWQVRHSLETLNKEVTSLAPNQSMVLVENFSSSLRSIVPRIPTDVAIIALYSGIIGSEMAVANGKILTTVKKQGEPLPREEIQAIAVGENNLYFSGFAVTGPVDLASQSLFVENIGDLEVGLRFEVRGEASRVENGASKRQRFGVEFKSESGRTNGLIPEEAGEIIISPLPSALLCPPIGRHSLELVITYQAYRKSPVNVVVPFVLEVKPPRSAIGVVGGNFEVDIGVSAPFPEGVFENPERKRFRITNTASHSVIAFAFMRKVAFGEVNVSKGPFQLQQDSQEKTSSRLEFTLLPGQEIEFDVISPTHVAPGDGDSEGWSERELIILHHAETGGACSHLFEERPTKAFKLRFRGPVGT